MATIPLVVIVGPTASGKTGLAIKVAKELGGEVISADSRAIYKGMDIGSAKPTAEEMQGVQHWGFDLVEPGERFTAANFQHYARTKIDEISKRGKVPMLVGGTGLYIDSLLFNYEFPPQTTVEERAKWAGMSLEQLHKYCVENNIQLPQNHMNKRHVVNSIMHNGHALKMSRVIDPNTVVVGISTEKKDLIERIAQRTAQFMKSGVLEEAKVLAEKYGWENEAMTGNIYPLARDYLERRIDYNELTEKFNTKEWRLAKRQITWFKRNEHIKWLPLDLAYTYIIHEFARLNKS